MTPAIRQRANLYRQLADSTRLTVLAILAERGPTNVGTLCKAIGCSQPAVSHHLSLLRHGRLVQVDRRGKKVYYSLASGEEEQLRLLVGGLTVARGSARCCRPRDRQTARKPTASCRPRVHRQPPSSTHAPIDCTPC